MSPDQRHRRKLVRLGVCIDGKSHGKATDGQRCATCASRLRESSRAQTARRTASGTRRVERRGRGPGDLTIRILRVLSRFDEVATTDLFEALNVPEDPMERDRYSAALYRLVDRGLASRARWYGYVQPTSKGIRTARETYEQRRAA